MFRSPFPTIKLSRLQTFKISWLIHNMFREKNVSPKKKSEKTAGVVAYCLRSWRKLNKFFIKTLATFQLKFSTAKNVAKFTQELKFVFNLFVVFKSLSPKTFSLRTLQLKRSCKKLGFASKKDASKTCAISDIRANINSFKGKFMVIKDLRESNCNFKPPLQGVSTICHFSSTSVKQNFIEIKNSLTLCTWYEGNKLFIFFLPSQTLTLPFRHTDFQVRKNFEKAEKKLFLCDIF